MSAGTGAMFDARRPDPRWLSLMLRLQFEINCASSVAIEVPALRPYAKELRDA